MKFRVHAVDAGLLGRVRAGGSEPVVAVAASGGEPLRCCLRNAAPGEQLILFGYEPPLPVSPYREIGPVFAHADAQSCPGPASTDAYPADWHGRPQVLRAYDARGWIHEASRTHDGAEPEAAIDNLLADPTVAQIHSRNVAYGCFMFAITRPEDEGGDFCH